MTRIALVCSEPIRSTMAGIGIRYLEFARRLPEAGIDAILVSPTPLEQMESLGLQPERARRFERGRLAKILGDCDGIVAQGHLANDVLIEVPGRPTAIDLYDPFLVENLTYAKDRRSDPFVNDHATWQLQMSRGDFFLCSNDVQRMYYLGFLTALGRVNPDTLRSDPELSRLVAVVPFGLPEKLADHRPYLPPAASGSRRLLFGGLYDWYDPWTVLKALEIIDRPDWSVIFVRNPNPETTPQGLLSRVEEWARGRGWLGNRVELIDWVPAERRFDLLRDVDALVATHPAGFETELSLRTRFLEAMLAGCPVVASAGGAMAGLIEERHAGFTIPVGDPGALATCLASLFADPVALNRRIEAGRALAAEYSWDRAIQALLPFCRSPWVDPGKAEISRPPEPKSVAQHGAMDFSIIIPTHNRLERLGEVLEAIEQQANAPAFELVIVDDGSTDGTAAWLAKRRFERPHHIVTQKNRGPSAARNAGLAVARGKWVAFLGDDIVPARNWLASHHAAHLQRACDPKLAVIGYTGWHQQVGRTRFLDYINEQGPQFGYSIIEDRENVPFNFFYGSNLSLSRDFLRQNPFNDVFPHAAWEDIECGYRLKKAGMRLVYSPDPVALHHHDTNIARFCRRQEKVGYSSVIFYQLAPELGSFLGVSPEGPPPGMRPIKARMLELLARAIEHTPLSMPSIWEKILRDHYIRGLHRAWSDLAAGRLAKGSLKPAEALRS